VIIDNRAGAGGNVGAEVVYRAEPDGYTLLCSPPGPLSINHNLYKTLPYDWTKGEGPALVDIGAGRVDIFIGNISASLRFEKQKQVKFLGLASRTRSPVAPDVPTTAELGLPDLVASAWFALVAPPGTPDAIAQKVNADLVTTLKSPELRARFLELGAEPQGGTTAATAAFIKDEEARWRGVIKSANVTLE
jgi:tripartite-type tricarboxylate transporter receptor subunit TctC